MCCTQWIKQSYSVSQTIVLTGPSVPLIRLDFHAGSKCYFKRLVLLEIVIFKGSSCTRWIKLYSWDQVLLKGSKIVHKGSNSTRENKLYSKGQVVLKESSHCTKKISLWYSWVDLSLSEGRIVASEWWAWCLTRHNQRVKLLYSRGQAVTLGSSYSPTEEFKLLHSEVKLLHSKDQILAPKRSRYAQYGSLILQKFPVMIALWLSIHY